MSKFIGINSDVGESFGRYKLGFDEELMKYVTSINIACGLHAGDPMVMRKTVFLAKENRVKVGAHPSYPDLQGFGRRSIEMSEEEVENFVLYQIGALSAFLKIYNLHLHHIKPHGALYNDAIKKPLIAKAIGKAVLLFDKNVKIYGLSGSKAVEVWKDMGLDVFEEVFADRNILDNGLLVPRREPNAVVHDTEIIRDRITSLIRYGEMESINGKRIKLNFDTICVHGDTPNALNIAKTVREVLEREGLTTKNE